MSWYQFSLDCQADDLEQVEDLMQWLGALSISIRDAADDPIYEPLPGNTPVWPSSVLTATFDADEDADELQNRIAGGNQIARLIFETAYGALEIIRNVGRQIQAEVGIFNFFGDE